MEIEQFICMIFAPIGILLAGICIYEKNYMFNIDNYVIKFSKKHNVDMDKTTYCRFEGMHRIKIATSLLILDVMFFLFEVKDFKNMLIILCIWGIADTVLHHRKKKKLINMLPQKMQY